MNKVAVGVIAAVVVVAAAFAIIKLNKKPETPTQATTSQPNATPAPETNQPATSDKPAEQASTIDYSDSGFSPATLTVKSGTTVTIKNSSSRPLQFDSNPHPQHTDDPELNVGIVPVGVSKTFKVTVTGSHGYHNHLNSSDQGVLVVE